MNTTNAQQNTPRRLGQFRPTLNFYHANAKGTGCAISLELHPAHDNTDGCIMMKSAMQLTVGDRQGATPTFSRFDWDGAIRTKLDFSDLCQFLQVFRGEQESINDGHGLYHRSPSGTTRILLRHLIEPVSGYSLELYRTPSSGEPDQSARILFSPAEAHGLCEAISGVMSVIGFGIPMLVPHDTSAYVAARKAMRDAHAA